MSETTPPAAVDPTVPPRGTGCAEFEAAQPPGAPGPRGRVPADWRGHIPR